MQFYQIEAYISDADWVESNNNVHVAHTNARAIFAKTRNLNVELDSDGFFCVSSINDDQVLLCAIVQNKSVLDKNLPKFLRASGLPLSDLHCEETTLENLRNLLSAAERNDYINDNADVYSKFGLTPIIRRFGYSFEFSEKMIEEVSKQQAYKQASEFVSNDSLVPELDKIFSPSGNNKIAGHPVQYMVETDDRDIRKGLYGVILRSLYAVGRIKNRRYTFMDAGPCDEIESASLEALYNCCVGGAISIRFPYTADMEETEYASNERGNVFTICEAIKKYHNQVLTILCLPKKAAALKQLFFEELGGLCFVEIKEDALKNESAVAYLKGLTKNCGIRADKGLLSVVETDAVYLPSELKEKYDEWFDHKLRTTAYPQYKDSVAIKEKQQNEKAKGLAINELKEMIGLTNAKQVIGEALDFYKAQKLFKDKGMNAGRPAMHMIFTGNPGTAKTSVARLFSQIMRDNGILSSGHLVEVGRSDLVGKYVGWTAKIVKKKFKEAEGGVLFIDEAYSLVDYHDNSFGDEAINTIVQEMENHRNDMAVIFAGYPDKMQDFLERNPGLSSRIAFHIDFEDYSTQELCSIAQYIAKNSGLVIEKDALDKMFDIFEDARKNSDFGNGRFVRNIIEKARIRQASRLVNIEYDKVSEKDVRTIKAEDIEIRKPDKEDARRIGFCA